MATAIEYKDVGPIEKFRTEIPDRGGILCFQGKSGVGKTTAINAFNNAVSGNGKLSVRDGATMGEVSAFGAKVMLGARTNRFGQPEAVGIESRYDIGSLVDPGIKDPMAADARRIKALVQIAGVEAKQELFYEIVGGPEQFSNLFGDELAGCDDLVEMAGKIERRLQKLARDREDSGNIEVGHIAALREAAGKVDVTVESDHETLQAALLAAVGKQSALETQAKAYAARARDIQRAKDMLSDAEAETGRVSAADAQAATRVASAKRERCIQDLRNAEELFRSASAALDLAKSEEKAALAAQQAAEQHEQHLAQWRQTIEGPAAASEVSQEDLETAKATVDAAQRALELGSKARQAKRDLAQAELHSKKAAEHKTEAERLRRAAGAVDDVLSGLVAKTGSPLRVRAGRLVLDTKTRGETFYAELSDGERTKIGVDVAISAFPESNDGRRQVIGLGQKFFQDLGPSVRLEVAEHARSRNVLIVSALVTDDQSLTSVFL